MDIFKALSMHVCACVSFPTFSFLLKSIGQLSLTYETKCRNAISKSFHYILFCLVKIQFTFYSHKNLLS